LFHERPSMKVLIAMGLIVAAVLLLGWDATESRQTRAE
jgi:drug/metabolite transporter (DMT)-like permease